MPTAERDSAVRLEVYRFFVERGRPPAPHEVAESLSLHQGEVEDSMQRLADAHALVLAPGTSYVWMANPLSAVPTSFPVTVGDRVWFGNCIWDALGVVAMLGGTGTVHTSCPDCGLPLSVSVDERRVSSGEGVAHFAVPASHWWDDIGFN